MPRTGHALPAHLGGTQAPAARRLAFRYVRQSCYPLLFQRGNFNRRPSAQPVHIALRQVSLPVLVSLQTGQVTHTLMTNASCTVGRFSGMPVRHRSTNVSHWDLFRGEGAGQTSCQQCPTGYYANSTGSPNCTATPAGYAVQAPSSAPIACAPGNWSSALATSCLACSPGTFAATVKSATCQTCPAGTLAVRGRWLDSDGLSHRFILHQHCRLRLPCWQILQSVQRSVWQERCPEPMLDRTVSGQTACTNCSLGWYSSSSNSGSCTQVRLRYLPRFGTDQE